MPRLKVRISNLDPPAEGNRLVLSVGEIQTIAAKVKVVGCEGCVVELGIDGKHFELIEGEIRAELGSGTFERTLVWTLRAVAPGDSLSVDVGATANGESQAAMIPARIHPMPRIED